LFLGLFVFYLALVWFSAYDCHRLLYESNIRRRTYILSNISFSIPVLLPWLCLSGVADLIQALPFQAPKQIMATTEGQIGYFLVFLFVIAVVGPLMIQKFWRCRPLEAGPERVRIDRLCRRAGMQYADILYWPIFGGRMITAGVMGLIRRFRYILVTRSLMKVLAPDEIDSVIAHEIGHIKKGHLLFYLFFFVGFLLISYVSFDLIIYLSILTRPVQWLIYESGINQTTAMSLLFGIVFIGVLLVYFRFVFGYFMRNFERQADTFVFRLFDSARHLISTLEKIAFTSRQDPARPNWHHYSILERIEYLKKCESNPEWIHRHDKKVRRSVGLYLVAMLVIGVVGYQLNLGSMGNRLNSRYLIQIVSHELERSPNDPNLYSLLGDLHYQQKNYTAVRDAYEKAVALNPDSPQVLNNLAWLYATCEDERIRHPERALVLARRAAALAPSAHILDTLAESYFVNGMVQEAIEVEKQALAMAKENRALYEQQLKRFREALE
jgi:Zn-dependent protease with chaperone function